MANGESVDFARSLAQMLARHALGKFNIACVSSLIAIELITRGYLLIGCFRATEPAGRASFSRHIGMRLFSITPRMVGTNVTACLTRFAT